MTLDIIQNNFRYIGRVFSQAMTQAYSSLMSIINSIITDISREPAEVIEAREEAFRVRMQIHHLLTNNHDIFQGATRFKHHIDAHGIKAYGEHTIPLPHPEIIKTFLQNLTHEYTPDEEKRRQIYKALFHLRTLSNMPVNNQMFSTYPEPLKALILDRRLDDLIGLPPEVTFEMRQAAKTYLDSKIVDFQAFLRLNPPKQQVPVASAPPEENLAVSAPMEEPLLASTNMGQSRVALKILQPAISEDPENT